MAAPALTTLSPYASGWGREGVSPPSAQELSLREVEKDSFELCNGQSHVSSWWGHSRPGNVMSCYFWECLWWCFWKRLAFASVCWVKQIVLSSVGGHHSVHWEPEENKNLNFCPWGFWSSGLRHEIGIYTLSFPGSPACRCCWQTMGLLSLHNYMSQNLMINLFLDLSVCLCLSHLSVYLFF